MEQPELDLRIVSDSGVVHINSKCMLKKNMHIELTPLDLKIWEMKHDIPYICRYCPTRSQFNCWDE